MSKPLNAERWCPECDCVTVHSTVGKSCYECCECGEVHEEFLSRRRLPVELPDLTPDERAAMEAADMTPILGTPAERYRTALDFAMQMFRQRNRFAKALVWIMDGIPDHEIQAETGDSDQDCKFIAEAREEARELIQLHKGDEE